MLTSLEYVYQTKKSQIVLLFFSCPVVIELVGQLAVDAGPAHPGAQGVAAGAAVDVVPGGGRGGAGGGVKKTKCQRFTASLLVIKPIFLPNQYAQPL